MRLHVRFSKNLSTVPFNYHQHLVGALHKWIGEKNELHDQMSLYSMSWLTGKHQMVEGVGLNFPRGAEWFLSAPNEMLLKGVVTNMMKDNSFAFGMKLQSIAIQPTPHFGNIARFQVATPVLIKRNLPNQDGQFFYFRDENTADYLTETLQNKLRKSGMNPDGVRVQFDLSYHSPQLKSIVYKGFRQIGSVCPILIEGSAEQIGFAWDVGIGNATGIGFGSLV